MAQSVKHLTLGFSSGHDLIVHEFEPCISLCADSVEPAWDSLAPSLSLPDSQYLKKKGKKEKKHCLLHLPMLSWPFSISFSHLMPSVLLMVVGS